MTKILFVCLGNICRSPMAEGLLQKKIQQANQEDRFFVDSAATSSYEVGNRPHPGTQQIFCQENISFENMRARQIRQDDFKKYDWIIGMDQSNVDELKELAPEDAEHKVRLFLDVVPEKQGKGVPDPYYTHDFDETHRLLNEGLDYWWPIWTENNQ